MRHQAGFTLMELMIVVAIVAILVAVGLPSYRNSIVQANRTDAQGALQGFAQAMERHFNRNYTFVAAGVGGADTGAPDPGVYASTSPLDGTTPLYNLTIVAADGAGYRLRATPIASGAQNGDGFLELDSLGVKSWDRDNDGAIATTERTWNR